jgi:uncharacterized protein YndB with AHSA1/START domain
MPAIQHKTFINVPPEKVYTTLTTAEGWNAWFTDETSFQGTEYIRLRWNEYGEDKVNVEDGGRILKAIPHQNFTFQWSPGEAATTVSFHLESYEKGTLVTLNETGYSDSHTDVAACIGCAIGWGEALTLLKFYLEYGIVCKEDLKA